MQMIYTRCNIKCDGALSKMGYPHAILTILNVLRKHLTYYTLIIFQIVPITFF